MTGAFPSIWCRRGTGRADRTDLAGCLRPEAISGRIRRTRSAWRRPEAGPRDHHQLDLRRADLRRRGRDPGARPVRSTGSTSTRPGSATRGSTRSTAGGTRCHRPDRPRSEGPTLFATQSTHKLLPALSQASMLHVRQGRARSLTPVQRSVHDALLDLAGLRDHRVERRGRKMMEGPTGRRLDHESIEEAIVFRKTVARIRVRAGEGGLVLRELAAGRGHRSGHRQADAVRRGARRVAADRPALLGAPPGRLLARLRRPGRRPLHARPDQGRTVTTPAWATTGNLELRGISAPGRAGTWRAGGSSSRRRPTSPCCSCSAWGSRRASGGRWSAPCSSSGGSTTSTRGSWTSYPTW